MFLLPFIGRIPDLWATRAAAWTAGSVNRLMVPRGGAVRVAEDGVP